MEQKIIGRIFFAETLIMGIISILIGIFFGIFCSQFITAMFAYIWIIIAAGNGEKRIKQGNADCHCNNIN